MEHVDGLWEATVIENERELKAATEWIEYWKSTRRAGLSWIGNEQGAQKIVQLRREIDAYRRRQTGLPPVAEPPGIDGQPSGTPA